MKNFRKNFNLKHCVIRFIMAWCFVCLIEAVWIAVTAKKKMSTLSYVGEVPVALHILTIAVLFAVLYILFENKKYPDRKNAAGTGNGAVCIHRSYSDTGCLVLYRDGAVADIYVFLCV